MKLKRWLSRGIVLAMVVALMVPMPVAAKGKSGGKLVKSVTYYTVDQTGKGWEFEDDGYDKISFKYGKKNMPTEVTYSDLTTYLGVPVAGSSVTEKIKYKGKTQKRYDSAGFLSEKAKLKGGKIVSWSWDSKYSYKTEKDGVISDYADLDAGIGHASYFKNGLMKASDGTYSGLNSDNESYAYTTNAVYAWTQKKGIPSMMVKTSVANGKDGIGREYDGKASTRYAIFNAKGLVIEEGKVVDGKNVADKAYVYTMKKGKVDTAVVYKVEEGKPSPQTMMKFKYTKKSVSKKFNARMMNDLMGVDGFIWY